MGRLLERPRAAPPLRPRPRRAVLGGARAASPSSSPSCSAASPGPCSPDTASDTGPLGCAGSGPSGSGLTTTPAAGPSSMRGSWYRPWGKSLSLAGVVRSHPNHRRSSWAAHKYRQAADTCGLLCPATALWACCTPRFGQQHAPMHAPENWVVDWDTAGCAPCCCCCAALRSSPAICSSGSTSSILSYFGQNTTLPQAHNRKCPLPQVLHKNAHTLLPCWNTFVCSLGLPGGRHTPRPTWPRTSDRRSLWASPPSWLPEASSPSSSSPSSSVASVAVG